MMIISFFSILLSLLFYVINAKNLFLQGKRQLSSCYEFNSNHPPVLLFYYSPNSSIRFYLNTSYTEESLQVEFINSTNNSFPKNCSHQDGKIECKITSINDLYPGIYNVAFKTEGCSRVKSSFLILLEQRESEKDQITVKTFSLANKECTSSSSFTIDLINAIPSKDVNGAFVESGLNNFLYFHCNDIVATGNITIFCDLQNEEEIKTSKIYSLNSLFYSINNSQQIAFILTKEFFTFNYDYNPIDASANKKEYNISNSEDYTLQLTFEKEFSNSNLIILFGDKQETCQSNGKLLTCTIKKNYEKGSYPLQYENVCNKKENLNIILNVDVGIVFNYPNFTLEIENSTCRSSLNDTSFTLSISSNEVATTSIQGKLNSGIDDIIFICVNNSRKITCSTAENKNIEEGIFSIDRAQLKYNTTDSYNLSAYLSGNDTFITINSSFVPLKTMSKQTISINYGKSNSFMLSYISTPKITNISLIDTNNIEYPLGNAIIANETVTWLIKDPKIIPSNNLYTVNEYNACGVKTETNLTIKTQVIVVNDVTFNQSEVSCTHNISSFAMIISNSIKAGNFIGNLQSSDKLNFINFTCNNITEKEKTLSCSVNNSISYKTGIYNIFNLSYIPIGNNSNYNTRINAEIEETVLIPTLNYNPDSSMYLSTNSEFITIIKNNPLLLNFTRKVSEKIITFVESSSGYTSLELCQVSTSKNSQLNCPTISLPQGNYTISLTNDCKKEEKPKINIQILDNNKDNFTFSIGKPSFQNDEVCLNEENFPFSFSVPITNTKAYTYNSFEGYLISKINNNIKEIDFSCDGIPPTEIILHCKILNPPSNGRYVIHNITGITNTSITVEGYLSNQVTYFDYYKNYIPYLPENNTLEQFIYDTNTNHVTIVFNKTIQNKEMIFVNDLTKKEYPLNNCSVQDNVLQCNVSHLEGTYTIFYINECNVYYNTSIKVYISNGMVFGSPIFTSSNCTNSPNNFIIPLIGDYIPNSGVNITLIHHNYKDSIVNYQCSYLPNYFSSQSFNCVLTIAELQEIEDGPYSINSINYINTNTNKEEHALIHNSNEYDFMFNLSYIELSTNQNYQQKIDFLTNTNIIINFQSDNISFLPINLKELNDSSNYYSLSQEECIIKNSNIICQLNESNFKQNKSFNAFITNACGKEENTNITIEIIHLTSNLSYDPGLDELSNLQTSFYDPNIDHNSYLQFSYMILGIFIFFI